MVEKFLIVYLLKNNMEDTNIFAVVIALIAGLTTSQAWSFWQRKVELKRETEYTYRTECKYRIDKLEDELLRSEKDKEELFKQILDLSTIVAELKTRLEMMEKGSLQHKGL